MPATVAMPTPAPSTAPRWRVGTISAEAVIEIAKIVLGTANAITSNASCSPPPSTRLNSSRARPEPAASNGSWVSAQMRPMPPSSHFTETRLATNPTTIAERLNRK